MKFVVLGRGHRVVDLIDTLSARGRSVTVVTSDEVTLRGLLHKRVGRVAADPSAVSFDGLRLALQREDMIVVAEHEEAPLRALLENVVRQRSPATIVVFTPLPTRELAAAYPDVLFRSDRAAYGSEIRDLTRRAATRQKVDAIRKIVSAAPRVVTIIWGNPDPDAIGSAYALRELFAVEAPSWTIAYLGEYTRPENLAMVRTIKIPTVKYAPELVTPQTVVATVDAQPSFFPAGGSHRFDIIVDHHPLMDLGAHRYADVRPTYGSTAAILTEYYQLTGARMPRRVATALLYGLKVDTGNLTRNVSDADVNAFRWLRQRADENMLRAIELTQLPVSTLDHFSVAIANKKISRDVIFSYLGTVENPDACVHVADFFIKISGVSWAVVACRTRDRVVIVFRSDGFRKHAGTLAERLFIEYGSAGGHRTMARAELQAEKLATELPEFTDVALERWLVERLAQRLKPLARLRP